MRCIHESNHLTHTSSVEIFDFWPSHWADRGKFLGKYSWASIGASSD